MQSHKPSSCAAAGYPQQGQDTARYGSVPYSQQYMHPDARSGYGYAPAPGCHAHMAAAVGIAPHLIHGTAFDYDGDMPGHDMLPGAYHTPSPMCQPIQQQQLQPMPQPMQDGGDDDRLRAVRHLPAAFQPLYPNFRCGRLGERAQ